MKINFFFFILFSIFWGQQAFAQQFAQQEAKSLCLYCKEPDKVYRCSVIGEGQINSKITKLYCLIKTAKDQKHASCRVMQNTSPNCQNSTEITYLYEGPNVPGLTSNKPAAREIDRLEQKNKRLKANNVPSTLVEFTDKSLQQSKDNLKKTGKVIENGAKQVGGAVKGVGDFVLGTTVKTVKCIFTLFNKCSEPQSIQNLGQNPSQNSGIDHKGDSSVTFPSEKIINQPILPQDNSVNVQKKQLDTNAQLDTNTMSKKNDNDTVFQEVQ